MPRSKKQKDDKKRQRRETHELTALNWLILELKSDLNNHTEIILSSPLIPNAINYFSSFITILRLLNTPQAELEFIHRMRGKFATCIKTKEQWIEMSRHAGPVTVKKIGGEIKDELKTTELPQSPIYPIRVKDKSEHVADYYFSHAYGDPLALIDEMGADFIHVVANPNYLKRFLREFLPAKRLAFFFHVKPSQQELFLTKGDPDIIQANWIYFADEKNVTDTSTFCRMLRDILAPNHDQRQLVEPFIKPFLSKLHCLIQTHADLKSVLKSTFDYDFQRILLLHLGPKIKQFARTAEEEQALEKCLVWDNARLFRACLAKAVLSPTEILRSLQQRSVLLENAPNNKKAFKQQLTTTDPKERLAFVRTHQAQLFEFFPTPIHLGKLRLQFTSAEQQSLQRWYKEREKKNVKPDDYATWKRYRT